MSKKHYSDYVNHMLKLYFNCSLEKVNIPLERNNWMIVNEVFKNFSVAEVKILESIYSGMREYNIAEKIKQLSDERKIKEAKIWKLLNAVSKEIAKERGLI